MLKKRIEVFPEFRNVLINKPDARNASGISSTCINKLPAFPLGFFSIPFYLYLAVINIGNT